MRKSCQMKQQQSLQSEKVKLHTDSGKIYGGPLTHMPARHPHTHTHTHTLMQSGNGKSCTCLMAGLQLQLQFRVRIERKHCTVDFYGQTFWKSLNYFALHFVRHYEVSYFILKRIQCPWRVILFLKYPLCAWPNCRHKHPGNVSGSSSILLNFSAFTNIRYGIWNKTASTAGIIEHKRLHPHTLEDIKVRTCTAIDPTVRHCHYYLRSFRASDASDAAPTISAW